MLISSLVMVAMATALALAAFLKSPSSLLVGLKGGGGFMLQSSRCWWPPSPSPAWCRW